MKLAFVLVVAALGLSQLAYANHHEGADGKSCGNKKHGMMDNDANKDGAISKEEFMSGHQARADKMFAKMDANSDGKVDEAERDTMKAKWKEHHKDHKMQHGVDHQ